MDLQHSSRDILFQQVKKAFVTNKEEPIATHESPDAWIFDFRRLLMNGAFSHTLGKVFWGQFNSRYPFQLGTIEIAGVPLATSLMKDGYHNGLTDINAFFIRKSRKKTGLTRMIEGEILKDVPIVLVDDLMNTGSSFWRQIEVIEELGYKVTAIWSILRFRDLEFYKRFYDRGIEVHSVFSLDDFANELSLPLANIKNTTPPIIKSIFKPEWTFKSKNPSFVYVAPKSQPVLDEDKIYFGADNKTFWAINQNDGSVAWQFQVGKITKGKAIFSTPALYKNLVIFGSYDGAVYGLDTKTGKKIWEFLEADWVGSSPSVDQKRGVVFIGLEFGLIRKHGGIAALDAQTGRLIWSDYTHGGLTHASPLYIPSHNQVAIGSNDGRVRLYDAQTGKLIWSFTTFGGADYDELNDGGFGKGDIKGCCVYADTQDYLIFGSIDSFLYILDRKTGHLVHHFKCAFPIISTPYIFEEHVYFTSLDKHIRCLSLKDFTLVWERFLDKTRIFAGAVVINNKLYVGTNSAKLHELDPKTGESFGYLQVNERITNSLTYNPKTKAYFLPTYANEIIKMTHL